jgi:aminopeptidase N
MFALLALAHVGPEVRTEDRGLTERHALYRADLVSKVRYELGFSLDATSPDYEGTAVIHFTMARAAPITIDFEGGTIGEAIVNGSIEEVPYRGRFIELSAEMLHAGENVVKLRFAHPYSSDGIGLHRHRDPEDGRIYLFTDLEPYLANMVFPCFDQPDLKATYRVTVEAPVSWHVITAAKEQFASAARSEPKASEHGRAAFAGPGPVGSSEAHGERRVVVFAETLPFSTYLFSLHAGEYAVFEADGPVPLRFFIRQALAKHADADAWLDATKRGLAFYGEWFGVPYPFGKYDQIVAPALNYEAMENVAAVTYSEELIFRGEPTAEEAEKRTRIILHEMAHMWFGNLVTMRWWDDLWLNEAFATYLATIASPEPEKWVSFLGENVWWGYLEDQLVTTHPVEADVPSTEEAFANFDGITYGKGSAALKQLSFVVGPEAFQAGVRRYFERYAYGNTERRDFVGALAEASGADLSAWTDAWLRTSGVNGVLPSFACTDGRISAFELLQTAPDRHPHLRSHRTRLALYTGSSSEIVDATFEGSRTRIDAAIGKPCPSMVIPNAGGHDYAKLILDERTRAAVRTGLSAIPDALTRLQLYLAEHDRVRDGMMSVEDYVTLLEMHLGGEPELRVVSAVLETVRGSEGILEYVSPASDVADRIERLARAGVERGKREHRKVWLVARIAAATKASADLEALLDADLDQDLRWTVVGRLSALGSPRARKLIDAERARDPSERGHHAALAAEASAPDARAKTKLIDRLEAMPLADAMAVMSGLFPYGQQDLHEKLLGARFFPMLDRMAKQSSSELLSRIVALAPSTCRPASTDRLAKYLETPDLPHVVRRPLMVALEEDRRCIRVRASGSN